MIRWRPVLRNEEEKIFLEIDLTRSEGVKISKRQSEKSGHQSNHLCENLMKKSKRKDKRWRVEFKHRNDVLDP